MAKHTVQSVPPCIGSWRIPIDPRETGHRVAYDREVPFELRVQAESHW